MKLLTQIKAVHDNCFNNCLSQSLHFPWSKTGVFKTPTMITCLDNRRRRVWCSASRSNYFLFVKIKGENFKLAETEHTQASFVGLSRLITMER